MPFAQRWADPCKQSRKKVETPPKDERGCGKTQTRDQLFGPNLPVIAADHHVPRLPGDTVSDHAHTAVTHRGENQTTVLRTGLHLAVTATPTAHRDVWAVATARDVVGAATRVV